MIDAGGHGDARDPVGKRHGALILLQTREHFHENFLGQILFCDPPGEMGAHNPNDKGIKVINQLSRCILITAANPLEALSQIKRLFIRHK